MKEIKISLNGKVVTVTLRMVKIGERNSVLGKFGGKNLETITDQNNLLYHAMPYMIESIPLTLGDKGWEQLSYDERLQVLNDLDAPEYDKIAAEAPSLFAADVRSKKS